MAKLESISPVLPTLDLRATLTLYTRLGFRTRAYEGPEQYGYARRDDVFLHFAQRPRHDPRSTASTVYLYVDDADALHAQWQTAGADGRLQAPRDTRYGLREGAYIDPDGNLIRYGSFLPGHGMRM